MTDIISQNIVNSPFFTQASTRFRDAYASMIVDTWSQEVATTETSSGAQTVYAWPSRLSKMKLWRGSRNVQSLATYERTIKNLDYEDTFAVERNHIEDDQVGIYKSLVDLLIVAARKWPDQLVANALINGTSTVGHDGIAFFATNHPTDPFGVSTGAAQSNYFTSSPLNPETYQTARAKMRAFRDEGGIPIGINPNVLLVPTTLETAARQIVEVGSFAPQTLGGFTSVGAQDNSLKGTAKVVVAPELNDEPNSWYLLDTRWPIRPVVFQQRLAPTFEQLMDPISHEVFNNNKYYVGARARGAADVTMWFMAAKGTA